MTLQLSPQAVDMGAIEQQIADVRTEAQAADGRAGRAMTRANAADSAAKEADAKTVTLADALAQLQQLATTLGQAIPAAEAAHAAINKRIDDIQLTPGPRGPQGESGTANLSLGATSVTLLALGASTTVVVPLARTLATTPANVQPAHSAVVNLANVKLEVTAKTTSTVTVKVTAVGIALAAGTLIVLCY